MNEFAEWLNGLAMVIRDIARTPVLRLDPRLALGEGQRMLSWIWYTVSEQEIQGDSKELEASEYLWRAWCSTLN